MLKLFGMDAHAPAVLMDVHAHVNVLTAEIKFATLIHGKPPLGLFLLWQTEFTIQS